MEWLKRLFGYRYLVNMHTGEVHNLDRQHINCCINFMAKGNKRLVSRRKALDLISKSRVFNGCRWCMGEKDTDTW